MRKFYKCGHGIWTTQEFDGTWYIVYHDDDKTCEEKEVCFDVVTHCPGCGEPLTGERLKDKRE